MNSANWSSPLDQDGRTNDEIALSPASVTKSPVLEFDWSNENSTFDNNGLDILDYNTISDCVDVNLISEVDLPPRDLSPLTPYVVAPLASSELQSPSFESSKLNLQPTQAGKEYGLDLISPEWNRQAFWKTVLSSSAAWSALNINYPSLVNDPKFTSRSVAIDSRNKSLQEESQELDILVLPQAFHNMLGMTVGMNHIHEETISVESIPLRGPGNNSASNGTPSTGVESNEGSEASAKVRSTKPPTPDRARPWACELARPDSALKGI